MIKSLFNKNYLFYGGSIIISRGLEYLIIFYAAKTLAKEVYGEFEFFKKVVEIGSNILSFGFPALILSYTKSLDSKVYFYLLSIVCVFLFSGLFLVFGFFNSVYFLLLICLIFYALYFTGGVSQSFQLVEKGSNYASLYKIVISILYFAGVFLCLNFLETKSYSILYPAIILLPAGILFSYFELKHYHIKLAKAKKYWRLFKKLLNKSMTLVVSNFANLMFLYTDIFILKLLSKNANSEIADFSFAVNIASLLLIIPMTLIQVEIEKLKHEKNFIYTLNKRINLLTILSSVALIISYLILINYLYVEYDNTFYLFLIILVGKVFLTLSNLFGTKLVILKKFTLNLKINILFLVLNILAAFLFYVLFGIIGLCISSSLMIGFRYVCLVLFIKKFNKVS